MAAPAAQHLTDGHAGDHGHDRGRDHVHNQPIHNGQQESLAGCGLQVYSTTRTIPSHGEHPGNRYPIALIPTAYQSINVPQPNR
ncbi:hypothetical protein [Planctopirus limnophila]|uniref:hypothetical protein n=1 Tax=Planctopirus limnophila TaxID=120 RepID=UPI0002D712FC|nr:hypothetical protein [Planctopirus limnophila]